MGEGTSVRRNPRVAGTLGDQSLLLRNRAGRPAG
jgi:hypothetical protein